MNAALPAPKTKIVATIGPASESPMLVAGPSTKNPRANHRIELMQLGTSGEAKAKPA